MRDSICIVEKENSVLNSNALEHRVEGLEKSTVTHDNLFNTNERFFRENNVCIVGVKHSPSGNCTDIARDIYKDITNKDIMIE